MDSAANNIFPFILDTLSQKPLLEDTEKNLLKNLRQQIKNKGLKINNLHKEFKQTLKIGEEIGILRFIDDSIRLPFKIGEKKEKQSTRSKSVPNPITEKERSSRRRRSTSRRRRQSRSGSRRRQSRSRSQRRRS